MVNQSDEKQIQSIVSLVYQDLITYPAVKNINCYDEIVKFASAISGLNANLWVEKNTKHPYLKMPLLNLVTNSTIDENRLSIVFQMINDSSRELISHYANVDSKIIKKIAKLITESQNALALVGAGVSFNSNLGRIIDAQMIIALRDTGIKIDSIEALNLTEEDCIKYWKQLSASSEASEKFINMFEKLVNEKKPNEAHALLASAFGIGLINHIACLNWDNLIKRAFNQIKENNGEIFRIPLKIHVIDSDDKVNAKWKMHGCVDSKEHPWKFPGESNVSEGLKKIIKEKPPTCVLILGTSLKDQAAQLFIKNHLKGPFKFWIDPFHQIPNGSKQTNTDDGKIVLTKNGDIDDNKDSLDLIKIILPGSLALRLILIEMEGCTGGYNTANLSRIMQICREEFTSEIDSIYPLNTGN